MKPSLIILFSIILFFTGCHEVKEKPDKKVESQHKTLNKKPFSNPAIIYGSSFGEFFRSLFRTGQYDMMIAFTESSLERDSIIKLYKSIDIGFEIRLKALHTQDSINYDLVYETERYATKGILHIPVVIINDTVKLDLDKFEQIKNLKM